MTRRVDEEWAIALEIRVLVSMTYLVLACHRGKNQERELSFNVLNLRLHLKTKAELFSVSSTAVRAPDKPGGRYFDAWEFAREVSQLLE